MFLFNHVGILVSRTVNRSRRRDKTQRTENPAQEIAPSCPLGISRLVPQDQRSSFWCFILHNKSFIDQACSVKMAGYWPNYFLRVHGPTSSRSINTQKRNLANVQPFNK